MSATDQDEETQGQSVIDCRELEGVDRPDEEVSRGQGAEAGSQQPRPEAAEVSDDQDRREECHVHEPIAQRPLKGPAQQQRNRRGQHGKSVDKQSFAGSFVHVNLTLREWTTPQIGYEEPIRPLFR